MSDPLNPIPIVQQAEEDQQVILERIATREREAATYAFQHAKNQGEDLSKLKQRQGHGNWTRWAAKNLPLGLRQAQRHLRIWERFKNDMMSFSTQQEALDFIDQEEEAEAEAEAEASSQPSANGTAPAQQAEPEKSSEPAPAEASPDASPSPPKSPVDPFGIPVPDPLVPVFDPEHEKQRQECLTLLRQLVSALNDYAKTPAGAFVADELKRLSSDGENFRFRDDGLQQLQHRLKDLAPYCSVCPWCFCKKNDPLRPKDDDRPCVCCKGRGWVPVKGFSKLPTVYREAVEALREEGGEE